MGKEKQAGHTPTTLEDIKNKTRNGIDRASRGGRHRNTTRKKRSEIINTFKGSLPEVGAVLGTRDNNFKESFQNLQEGVLQYVLAIYKKGLDIAPLVRKL